MRVVLAEDSSGIGACGYCTDLYLGMAEEQAKQLPTCITCSARYPDSHPHSHEYATVSNFMHMRLMAAHRNELRRCGPNCLPY
jgi:hypothetical protein